MNSLTCMILCEKFYIMAKIKDYTECASGFVTFDDQKLIVRDANQGVPRLKSLCWHCHEHIGGDEDIRIPFEIDNLKNIFYCKGYFCSFNCAMAYIIENPMFDMNVCRVNLYILARRYGIVDEIVQAPPKSLLSKFGGHMSMDDFRRNVKKCNRIISRHAPFIHTVDEVVEMSKPDDSFDKEFEKTMKLYASSANVPLQNMMSVTNLKHGQSHDDMIQKRGVGNDVCLFDKMVRSEIECGSKESDGVKDKIVIPQPVVSVNETSSVVLDMKKSGKNVTRVKKNTSNIKKIKKHKNEKKNKKMANLNAFFK